jgi:hypothetical protein
MRSSVWQRFVIPSLLLVVSLKTMCIQLLGLSNIDISGRQNLFSLFFSVFHGTTLPLRIWVPVPLPDSIRPCSWVIQACAWSVHARSILAAFTWRQERRVYPKHRNL